MPESVGGEAFRPPPTLWSRGKAMSKARELRNYAVIFLSLAFAPAASAATAVTDLFGVIGPGAELSLKQRLTIGITPVSSIRRGAYTIVVRDRSRADNFHLTGPGVDKATSKAFVGNRTWSLRLRTGIYTFRSDAHPLRLKKTFRVT
jgi:hypothetical protein